MTHGVTPPFPYTTLFRSQWSFTATQGDYIALSMGEVAPATAGFQPWIRLVSPTGVLLGNGIGDRKSQRVKSSHTRSSYAVIWVNKESSISAIKHDTASYLLTLAKGPATY